MRLSASPENLPAPEKTDSTLAAAAFLQPDAQSQLAAVSVGCGVVATSFVVITPSWRSGNIVRGEWQNLLLRSGLHLFHC